jgi:hypothetical protein
MKMGFQQYTRAKEAQEELHAGGGRGSGDGSLSVEWKK